MTTRSIAWQTFAGWVVLALAANHAPAGEPLKLAPGPHLFVDEHLIESAEGLTRRVVPPQRDLGGPVITGKEDGCFQPYMTVLRDDKTGRFRIWYGARTEDRNASRSRIAYMESDDGIKWQRPHRILDDPGPIQFGVSVIDEGAAFPEPAQRYKFGWWHDGGLKVAASPDGLKWTALAGGNVVWKHNHDINGIWRDEPRDRYIAIGSVYTEDPAWTGKRRITFQNESQDLVHWGDGHNILRPDEKDGAGETQFYAMDGFIQRGGLLIGMVKVLRDDLKADDPPDPADAYGIGYTTLAGTRAGKTWMRDRAKFFDRHPQPGAWDHAHGWIDEQLPVGDEVFLYYGGYARGHKVNRFEERQIGLVRMKRDRYVARETGDEEGLLRTRLLTIDNAGGADGGAAGRMTVNAAVPSSARLRVRLVDEAGAPLSNFDWQDVVGDGVALPVNWKGSLSALRGKPLRVEFYSSDTQLYGFELLNDSGRAPTGGR